MPNADDTAARLPAHARMKLAALDTMEREAKAARFAASDHVIDLRKRRDAINNQIFPLQRHKAENLPWNDENESTLAELNARLDAITAEIKSLSTPKPLATLPPQVKKRNEFLSGFVVDWRDFLEDQDRFTTFVSARAELPPGDVSISALDNAYREADAITDQIIALLATPLDIETQLKAMRRDVARLARKGSPKIDGVRLYRQVAVGRHLSPKKQGKIVWPLGTIFGAGLNSSAPIEQGTSFVCWLFRGELESRLESMLRERQGDEPGISIPDRERMETELRAKLLDQHRVISRIQSELLMRGERIEVRRLHPLAFLEIGLGERETPKDRTAFTVVSEMSSSFPLGDSERSHNTGVGRTSEVVTRPKK